MLSTDAAWTVTLLQHFAFCSKLLECCVSTKVEERLQFRSDLYNILVIISSTGQEVKQYLPLSLSVMLTSPDCFTQGSNQSPSFELVHRAAPDLCYECWDKEKSVQSEPTIPRVKWSQRFIKCWQMVKSETIQIVCSENANCDTLMWENMTGRFITLFSEKACQNNTDCCG